MSKRGANPQESRFSSVLRRLKQQAPDVAIFWALVVGYCAWLLSSVHDLGYARDEGFYFQAADSYLTWFKRLVEHPAAAVEQSMVDRYWRVNSEHPALIKSLFALSRHLLFDEWRWFPEPGTSYRFVGMVLGSLSVGVVYSWGRRTWGRTAGLMAALLFALIPRIFYHCHLDCFDVPVMAMWLFTTYIYWLGLGKDGRGRSLTWGLAAGVAYGFMLNTKHNSWLLPFALVGHVVLSQGPYVLRGGFRWPLRIPKALWFMAFLAPLIFYATWPWIWFDTFKRLAAYVKFHTAHVYYNMEFLGHTYFEPPFPRSYSWLMTLSTVPLVTLTLATIGLLLWGRAWLTECLLPWVRRLRSMSFTTSLAQDDALITPEHQRLSTQHLWALCVSISYAPWLLDTSPIFGGTKHWITAYPFLCLFAGAGFAKCCQQLRAGLAMRWQPIPVEGLAAVCVVLGPLTMTANSHPWGLSSYGPVVGGAPGAASLGLNRTFWGYTTGAVQEVINNNAKRNARIFIHDTALQSWNMMRKDKRVRKDLHPQLGVAGSSFAVYHHEQHMSLVEHQIWVDYGTVKPLHIGHHDGVPVVWLYQRPSRANNSKASNKPHP